jgi:hypothetical protein
MLKAWCGWLPGTSRLDNTVGGGTGAARRPVGASSEPPCACADGRGGRGRVRSLEQRAQEEANEPAVGEGG